MNNPKGRVGAIHVLRRESIFGFEYEVKGRCMRDMVANYYNNLKIFSLFV